MDLPEISISAEKVFDGFGLTITNTFIIFLVSGISLSFLFFWGLRKKEIVPNFFQNFVEWILENILKYIDGITADRKKTLEIFPLAASLFIFILFINLLEILPGLGVFHFLRSPSSDLSLTLALAITSMVIVHTLTIKNLGFLAYLKKFFNFKSPILFFVGILEGISEINRIISLAIRLFGNLLAGEIILIILSFLSAYLLPLPFLFLEIFVGLIQAMIFSLLVVIFYTLGVEKTEE